MRRELLFGASLGFTITFLLGYILNIFLGSSALNGWDLHPLSHDMLVGLAIGVGGGQVLKLLLQKPKKDTV